jgi:hypothetical protein
MTSWQAAGWNLPFTFWRQMLICSRQDIMYEDQHTTSNKSFSQSWTCVFQTCWPGKFSCLENCAKIKSTKLKLIQTILIWNTTCSLKPTVTKPFTILPKSTGVSLPEKKPNDDLFCRLVAQSCKWSYTVQLMVNLCGFNSWNLCNA